MLTAGDSWNCYFGPKTGGDAGNDTGWSPAGCTFALFVDCVK